MHEETYPAFFTPRDEEPSLSSSGKTSSEVVWLPRKEKIEERKGKQRELSIFSFKTIQKFRRPENRLPRDIYMKITIIISTRLFILFPNLIIKESYNWRVTRRVWGFRHQISKAKYLKISKTKYLKISQNVGSTYWEASGEHRGTVQNGFKTLRASAISGSGYV